jgi:TnsA endonuclease N terminal/TnsA endonuclease C terminal
MPLKPVRKIRPGSQSITGKRSSLKTQIIQCFESTLERDFLTILEFDDCVEDYGIQPVTIRYLHNNKPARYTPDVVVYYRTEVKRRPLLCEVKYEAELQEKKDYYEPKFRAACKYASQNGFEFKVITERDIRTDYLQNIKFLSRYRHSSIDNTCSTRIDAGLTERLRATPQELLTGGTKEENAKILYTLWQMLAEKIIMCDMQQKITMTSIIWKPRHSQKSL